MGRLTRLTRRGEKNLFRFAPSPRRQVATEGGNIMTRLLHLVRKTFLFAITIALLVSPSYFALAKGKGFKDVVKHIETNYGAKKVRIPFLGLANFAVKLVRPAGVKGFKLAVFEDQNFSAREGAASFDAVMREAYNKDWRPMVQVSSKRDGARHTFIYV